MPARISINGLATARNFLFAYSDKYIADIRPTGTATHMAIPEINNVPANTGMAPSVTTALAVNVLTGWDLKPVILGVGLFTIVYTMAGGMEAVVWTDVVQGVVLMAGGLFVLGRLLFAPEAGAPFAVVAETWRAGKLTRERERDLLAVWQLHKSGLAIA